MRMSALFLITGSALTAALNISCSQTPNENATPKPNTAPTRSAVRNLNPVSPTATPADGNTPAMPGSRLRNLPPEGGDKPTVAEFGGFSYSFKKDSEKTVATFAPKLLPWDKEIVDGAVRDVIYRSYGDRVDSAPRVEGTGSARTIRISGGKHQYTIVPVTEPSGEIHSLIITRLI